MKGKMFFIDAAAVLFCCLLLAVAARGDNGAVMTSLILVVGAAMLMLLSGKALYIAEILLPCACFISPYAALMIPTDIYVSCVNRHKAPSALAAVLLIVNALNGGGEMWLICLFAVTVLAAALGLRASELSARNNELIRMRDTDTQLALELDRRNKELLKKQDDEVNLATLKERNRIAREIHDNVGHLLSRALLQSGALLAVTDKEKMPVQYTQTSALKDTLGSAMNSIRESVHGLRDESIDLHRSVSEAVSAAKSKFSVKTELDFSETMPPKVKLCFIAVVKEAVSNAVKYSNGNELHIIIREHPALYQLYVTDNGTSAKIRHGGGMGLNNMRERAEALGGIFRVDTDNGFRVFISINRNREDSSDEDNSGR